MSIDISSLTIFSGNCQVKFWKISYLRLILFAVRRRKSWGEHFALFPGVLIAPTFYAHLWRMSSGRFAPAFFLAYKTDSF